MFSVCAAGLEVLPFSTFVGRGAFREPWKCFQGVRSGSIQLREKLLNKIYYPVGGGWGGKCWKNLDEESGSSYGGALLKLLSYQPFCFTLLEQIKLIVWLQGGALPLKSYCFLVSAEEITFHSSVSTIITHIEAIFQATLK